MPTKILFLCPHNAAKSLIAAELFNKLASEKGVDAVADSAGSEPSESVMPVVVSPLASDGIDVSSYQPRRYTDDDLKSDRVITLGCTPEEVGISPEGVEEWPDVPPVSEGPEESKAVMMKHLSTLLSELPAKS